MANIKDPLNPCLVTLLVKIISREKTGEFKRLPSETELQEIIDEVFHNLKLNPNYKGSLKKPDYEYSKKKLFNNSQNISFVLNITTLEKLLTFFPKEFGFTSFRNFSTEFANEEKVIKYSKQPRLKTLSSYKSLEQIEIIEWADMKCLELYSKSKINKIDVSQVISNDKMFNLQFKDEILTALNKITTELSENILNTFKTLRKEQKISFNELKREIKELKDKYVSDLQNATDVSLQNLKKIRDAFVEEGKIDEAIKAVEVYLENSELESYKNNIELSETSKWLGWAYYLKGNFQKSNIYFGKTISLNPNDLESALNLGNSFLLNGDYSECITILEKLLKEHSFENLSLSNGEKLAGALGQAYVKLGMRNHQADLEIKAIYYLEKAILIHNVSDKLDEATNELEYWLGVIFSNLGKAYELIGKFDKSEDYYKKALKKLRLDILTIEELNKLPKKEANKRVLNTESEFTIKAYLGLALALVKNKKNEEAKKYYDYTKFIIKIFLHSPGEDHASLNRDLGYIERETKNYKSAIKYFIKAIDLYEQMKELNIKLERDYEISFVSCYVVLAACYDITGEIEKEFICLKKYLIEAEPLLGKDSIWLQRVRKLLGQK